MKAIVVEKPFEIRIAEVEKPRITRGDEVLIRVISGGICGSDIGIYNGTNSLATYPRIIGHEYGGRIEEIGPEVTGLRPGDVVAVDPVRSCGHCYACNHHRHNVCRQVEVTGVHRDGGFAEYMLAKAQCLVKIPDDVDEAQACIVPCGGGVAYHAMVKRFQVGPEDRVLILGVGGLGIQAIEMCAICGAETIALDIDDDKLAAAKAAGATYAINTRNPRYLELLRDLGGGTVLFDTTGAAKALRDCVSVLKKGARILLVAYGPGREVHLDMADVVLNEFEILGSRGVGIQDVAEIMSLIERKKYAPIVQRYPLSEINEVIDKLNSNKLIGRAVLVP